MNRPRRPAQQPPRRRPGGPPASGGPPGGGPPRRRSPLDNPPSGFKILGTADRQLLMSSAQPLELVVLQGYAREIEDAYQKFGIRSSFEDFWKQHAHLLEKAEKLDEVLLRIQARKSGS
jgi:hypothetical protein